MSVKQKTGGHQMTQQSLSMGAVELNVKDLDLMINYYHQLIGLEIQHQDGIKTVLGRNNHRLLVLHKTELQMPHPAHAGLYHVAFLFPSRTLLARTVHRILTHTPHFFSGSADHLVSEAFYFNDPEGNGVELYYDRDRSMWEWEDSRIKMASVYIDPVEYITQHIDINEAAASIHVGHVHLKVGDIATAKAFYVDVVGFDVTAELPGALFVSVDRYHHHLGMNTWESSGAAGRNESLGLRRFELLLSDKHDLIQLKKRLSSHQVPFEEHEDSITFADPWNTTIQVTVDTKKRS